MKAVASHSGPGGSAVRAGGTDGDREQVRLPTQTDRLKRSAGITRPSDVRPLSDTVVKHPRRSCHVSCQDGDDHLVSPGPRPHHLLRLPAPARASHPGPTGEVYGAVALTSVTLGGLLAALVIRVMTAFLHRPTGGGSPPAQAPGALPGFRRVDLRQPRAFVGWVACSYPLPLERGT